MKIQFLVLFLMGSLKGFSQEIHHDINADVNIFEQSIVVTDSLRISEEFLRTKDTIVFALNPVFEIEKEVYSFSRHKIFLLEEDSIANLYALVIDPKIKGDQSMVLSYKGKVSEDVQEGAVAYARGFSTTSGIISGDGVYIAGSTVWIPYIQGALFSYELSVSIDQGWGVISAGTRTVNEIREGKQYCVYSFPHPTDEVHLIAGKFKEYSKETDHVLVQVFLRNPDKELANRYIDATIDYLKVYEQLIGEYPYSKFAMVENFWETGYGMPSFTLLGEKVIRFPFILHSSYPHELLHNWWGNSVYVDYAEGNWCEGLTAYMADHLIKEQMGQGVKYRREALEKFTNYVNESNDLPIDQFISRNNPAQEAIGYGKVMMVNEMLRYLVGDEMFLEAYSRFYKEHKFSYASFTDIRKSFEAVSGKDLEAFFDQWVHRKGAPALKLSNVSVNQKDNYKLTFNLSQVQNEEAFDLTIPIAIYLEGKDEVEMKSVVMNEKEQSYTFELNERPLKIDIDPQINVFRRLDRNEIPPILSQLFGAPSSVIILPSESPFLGAYEKLASDWKMMQEAQNKSLNVVMDSDIDKLPVEPCWIIGDENRFAEDYISKYFDQFLSNETKENLKMCSNEGSIVYAFLNPGNSNQVTGFLSSKLENAIGALTRKLTHYGKYSYLGFIGDDATNKDKGEFPALNSPLSYKISYEGETMETGAQLILRKALSR